MSNVLSVLKAIFVTPFVWAWTWLSSTAWPWLKSWVVTVEPKVGSAASTAVSKASGEVSYLWARLQSLGAGFTVLWKALFSLKFWTRVAVLAVLGSALVGAFVEGHIIGHRSVPALKDQVAKQLATKVSDDLKIKQLQADVSKAQAAQKAAEDKLATLSKPTSSGKSSTSAKGPKTSSVSVKRVEKAWYEIF